MKKNIIRIDFERRKLFFNRTIISLAIGFFCIGILSFFQNEIEQSLRMGFLTVICCLFLVKYKISNILYLYRVFCALISLSYVLYFLFFNPKAEDFFWAFLFPLTFTSLLGLLEGNWWSHVFGTLLGIIVIYKYIFLRELLNISLEFCIFFIIVYGLLVFIQYTNTHTREILLQLLFAKNVELEEEKKALEEAQNTIRTLNLILPFCSNCGRIRTESGDWKPPEEYLTSQTDTKITHGLCEECINSLYPDLAENVLNKRE